METPPVVITGARRSGTHLLYRLVDGHPQLSNGLVEVYYLEYLHNLSAEARRAFLDHFFTADLPSVLDDIDERDLLPLMRGDQGFDEGIVVQDPVHVAFDEQAFARAFETRRSSARRDVAGAWDAWFASFQSTLDPDQPLRPMVVKSPDYGASATEAVRNLPGAKVVFMTRDPFFAISSLRKLRSNQPSRYRLTTLRLLSEVSAYAAMHEALTAIESASPSQVAAVRFEDLLQDPDRTMADLAKFLGVKFQAALLEPTFRGQPWHGDSSFERLTGMSRKPLDPSRLLLSPAEKAHIAQALGPFLERHGYTQPGA